MKRTRSVSPLSEGILSQVMPGSISPLSDAETQVISDPIDLTVSKPHDKQLNHSNNDDETQTLALVTNETIDRDLLSLFNDDTQNTDRTRILWDWF